MATPRREAIAQLQQRIVALHTNRERLELQIAQQGGEPTAPIAMLSQRDEALAAIQQAEAELERLQAGPSSERAPYLGLDTFGERDADLFYGREALIQLLVEKVRGESLVAVLGPSGSGKSSAVLAGLLPALRTGDLTGSDGWRYVVLKPGARPLDALAAALSKAQGGDLGTALALRDALSKDRGALLVAAEMLGAMAGGPRLVVVVDQCEELWTQLPADPQAHEAFVREQQLPFINLLLHAVTAPSTPVLAILTMRADFLHRAAEIRDLANVVSSRIIVVSPMQPDELRAAIEQPAAAVGGDFEEGLVGALVDQVQGRPGALPLLEYTLLELWKARKTDGTMTWEAFRALGGVEGALAARADALIAQHYDTPQKLAELRSLLLRLVQPGEGAGDTRRRVVFADLAPANRSPEQVQQFLKPLIDERLLTTGRDDVTHEETIELSHEALIRSWPTFSRWIGNARDDVRLQLQLEDAARQWQANGEDASFLWSGVRLANADAWIKHTSPNLNERDKRFLVASRVREKDEAAAQEVHRQRELDLARRAQRTAEIRAASDRRDRWITLMVSVALVMIWVITSLLVFFYNSNDDNTFARSKDLLLSIGPMLGVAIGYYFKKASNDTRADNAESAVRKANVNMHQAVQERTEATARAAQAVEVAQRAERARQDEAAQTDKVKLLLRDVSESAQALLQPLKPAGGVPIVGDKPEEVEATYKRLEQALGKVRQSGLLRRE